MRKILIFCIVFSSTFFVHLLAQNITVTARIDSASMWIGEQTKLSFEISQQPDQKVVTPLFSDTIVGGLEIVEPMKADTVTSPDGHLLVTQNYVVTAFEDSLLYIPPYPFVLNGDTTWSKSLSLKVIQPFVIDTASNQVTDIKSVFTPKFYWKGLIRKILIALLILLLIVALVIVVRRLMHKKSIFVSASPEPVLPPYEVAISKLNSIKQQKLWQQNRTKEYHTELTDVIREYIERTFDIPCMEMTSDEIVAHLNHLKFESKQAYVALLQLLHLADLVKFAKWNPAPDEHELSLSNAFLFVDQTKIEESKTTEDANEEIPSE